MKDTYGELKLPKGFILYHTTDNNFIQKSEEDYHINYIIIFLYNIYICKFIILICKQNITCMI
jgi:hypothetical protein